MRCWGAGMYDRCTRDGESRLVCKEEGPGALSKAFAYSVLWDQDGLSPAASMISGTLSSFPMAMM